MDTLKVEIETLKDGFDDFKKESKADISRLGGKIDTLIELSSDQKLKYEILQHEHNDNKQTILNMQKDFKEYKEANRDEIKTLKRYRNLSNVVIGISSAVTSSVVTFLVIEYIGRR